MGYLNTANDMVENTTKVLSDVIDSKFATYLQGNGTPVLVTYYHIDDTLTTTDLGNYTVDEILGDDSPIRYNRIENFPLFGLKELIPSFDALDGNLYDMSIDGDVISLPGTIKPTPLDLFIYHYLDGSNITFKVTGIELSSIKNHDFYKMSISLKDINDTSTIDKAEKQCTKGYVAKVDNIGTQDRCIIEDKIYAEIESIEKLVEYLSEQYKTLFYDDRYNCILLRHSQFSDYPIYDPFLTKFIENNNLLDTTDKYTVLSNFDYRPQVDKWYKTSIWRYLELRNSAHLKLQLMEPSSFRTLDTNPFYYYGEESVFTLSLVPYPNNTPSTAITNLYGDRDLLYSIIYYDFPKKPSKPARPLGDSMVDSNSPIVKPNRDKTDKIDRFSNETRPNEFDKPDNTPKVVDLPKHPKPNSKPVTKEELYDIFDEVEENYTGDIAPNLELTADIIDDMENIPVYDEPVKTIPMGENEHTDYQKLKGPLNNTILDKETLDDIYDEDYMDDTLDIPVTKPSHHVPDPDPVPVRLYPKYMNFIRDYFVKDSLYNLFSVEDIDNLSIMDMEYGHTDFMHIPMLIYILQKYIEYLNNNC